MDRAKRVDGQSGFSLIELIVSIIITSILAVTATVYFLDFEKDAKKAAIKTAEGALRAGLSDIYSLAAIKGKEHGTQTIMLPSGQTVTLEDGYPKINGSDSFVQLTNQLKTWLTIDIVDRDTANNDRNAALFFLDKSSGSNRIYIFFSGDYDRKSGSLGCRISYDNNSGPNIGFANNDC